MELQVELLRVLESGTFTRTGGETPLPVDIRFLASTNRQPEEAIKQANFAKTCTTGAAHHLESRTNHADLVPRIQSGLPQALTSDKGFTPVAHDRAGMQPEAVACAMRTPTRSAAVA
jgi:Sigma-54 interaction domain